ncbi:unnamed protein product [Brachionus calyciflorus]|uniref:MULE transposase domain-containing protein n=1 Tax=Brachionus calyciflorus TaxID=104777 RepID=A0A814ATM7_9BILA|nr:unnamed protein product [Brachionus calyciflorus]
MTIKEIGIESSKNQELCRIVVLIKVGWRNDQEVPTGFRNVMDKLSYTSTGLVLRNCLIVTSRLMVKMVMVNQKDYHSNEVKELKDQINEIKNEIDLLKNRLKLIQDLKVKKIEDENIFDGSNIPKTSVKSIKTKSKIIFNENEIITSSFASNQTIDTESSSDEDEKSPDEDELESFVLSQLNELSISNNDDQWTISPTQRKGKNGEYGKRLSSIGFHYVKDRETGTEVQWKCDKPKCPGRAKSYGWKPPVEIVTPHVHLPNKERTQVLIHILTEEDAALNTNDIISRQRINRRRRILDRHGRDPINLCGILISDHLKRTISNKEFFYDDSGSDDPSRILIFTTEDNLSQLKNNLDWYCDGTFDISPTLFLQLYIIHVNINHKDLSLIYALLPDKNKKTYEKLFNMILSLVKVHPNSLNIDFEKAVICAANKVFPNCLIYGCFFHLSQSFLRKVQKKGLINEYYSDDLFRKSYRMMQSLAYLPEKDMIEGFLFLSKSSPSSFKPMLNYLEKNYIGLLKPNSKTSRLKPRFPIQTWNLYDRVLKELPRTNNSVESWHSQIQYNVKRKLKIEALIDLLRDEQSKVETELVKVRMGEVNQRKQSSIQKDRRILKKLKEYNGDFESFLRDFSLNLIDLD